MKVRASFVANSSSSAFLVMGIITKENQINIIDHMKDVLFKQIKSYDLIQTQREDLIECNEDNINEIKCTNDVINYMKHARIVNSLEEFRIAYAETFIKQIYKYRDYEDYSEDVLQSDIQDEILRVMQLESHRENCNTNNDQKYLKIYDMLVEHEPSITFPIKVIFYTYIEQPDYNMYFEDDPEPESQDSFINVMRKLKVSYIEMLLESSI